MKTPPYDLQRIPLKLHYWAKMIDSKPHVPSTFGTNTSVRVYYEIHIPRRTFSG